KDLPLQEFIPQLAVKTFDVAVLPGTSWLDVQRPHSHSLEPLSNCTSCKLRPIVGANVVGNASSDKQVRQSLQDVLAGQPPCHVDRQALSGAFVGGGSLQT